MGGRLVARRGVECTLSAPGLGDAAAPSHFPLGPLLAFQAAEFSIVNLETKNKPARRGGRGEVTGATAPGVCSGKAPPRAAPPTNHAPPLCPAQSGIWGLVAYTLERIEFLVVEYWPGPKAAPGRGP